MLNIDVCIPSRKGVSDSFINEIQKDTVGSIHVSRKAPLDVARKELISQVKSDIFLFLDDDIVYRKGLINGLYNYIFSKFLFLKKHDLVLPTDKEVGAVQGSTIPCGLGDNWDRFFSDRKLVSAKIIDGRMMLHNTLIKTSLVKDWVPPPNISGSEDWHLTNHIKKKNYTCVVAPTNSFHRSSWKKVRSNAIWHGHSYKLLKGSFPLRFVGLRFGAILKHLFMLPFRPRLSYYTIHQNYFVLKGCLS